MVYAPPWKAVRSLSKVPAGDAMHRIPLREGSIHHDLLETFPTTFLRTTCLVVSIFVCAPPEFSYFHFVVVFGFPGPWLSFSSLS